MKWKSTGSHNGRLPGWNDRLLRKARGSSIIVYHGIRQEAPPLLNSLFVDATAFEQHLVFYRKYFNVVSLDDYFNQRLYGDRFNICITFDNSFTNIYDYVLPLITRYQIPITFFVTARADNGILMTHEQLRTLAASPYATIGCHGYSHDDLARMSVSQAITAMRRCRNELERVTARAVYAITFPHGTYTKEVADCARTTGFSQLLTVDFPLTEASADPALRQQLTINPYLSIYEQMAAVVSGK